MGKGIDVPPIMEGLGAYERERQVEATKAIPTVTSPGEPETSGVSGQETEEEKH